MTAVLISAVHFSFFQDERLRLIDYQIENSASILISSDFSADQLEDLENADDIIHEVFGDDRLNALVVIYNNVGRAVYKSQNARVLPPRISVNDQWQTVEYQNHFIRLLTLPWKNRGLILQVGLVLDDDLLRWKLAARHLISYTALIILLVFIVAVLLTRTLLKPMRALSEYLHFLSERFDNGVLSTEAFKDGLMPEPRSGFMADSDEFIALTKGVKSLALKIRDSVRITQRGTAQIAHELKTPLTVIRNHLELGTVNASVEEKQQHLIGALKELDLMNALVEDFLMWARTENAPLGAFELHAVSLDRELKETVQKFEAIHPGRIELGEIEETQIFARLSFVQQIFNNLISNAIKYSLPDQKIIISLREGQLKVRDHGPGVAATVLKKLGEPFNSEQVMGVRGSGLGLAWVMSICRKYSWIFVLHNIAGEDSGLEASVDFSASLNKKTA